MKPRSGLDPASLTGRIAALDEQGSLDAVRARVQRGDDPLGIIADCQRGMQYVGEDYQSGKYFISGLIMAGEIFREAMEMLEPLLPDSPAGGAGAPAAGGLVAGGGAGVAAGSVVVCTVRGDIHDIGKSILVTLLRSHGFAVHDLGVDVPAAEVARQAVTLRPDVVGLSGLLTAAHPSMKETVAELRRVAPQLGHPPVIIIGGGAVDAQVCDWSGADLWAPDAVRGVELIRAHAKS
jgi:methylmalonyl-CoA mutase cobalamin-binding domain/chain